MSQDELLKHVPPEVVCRRAPLPSQQNALGPWRQAVAHFVKPEDDSKENDLWSALIYGEGDFENAKPKAFPEGEQGRPLRELLDGNRAPLELFREGIRRGRLQLPEPRWPPVTGDDATLVWGFHDVSQAVFIKAKALCTDLDFVGAADHFIGVLRAGEMICNAAGYVCDYLVGECNRRMAQAGIRSLAAREEVSQDVLAECLSGIERSLRSPDGLAECLRADLCCSGLPQLGELTECDDLETFVDRLLETCYSSQPSDPAEVIPDDGRVDWRRRQILSLLEGHPRPFDKLATAGLLGETVAERIEDLSYPPEPRILNVAGQWRRFRRWVGGRWWWRRTRWWPEQLTPDFPFEWMGMSDEARGKLAELPVNLEGFDKRAFASMQPPTEAEVLVCRKKLRRVANPVGLILAMHLIPTDASYFVFRYRAALQETRSLLAQRLSA